MQDARDDPGDRQAGGEWLPRRLHAISAGQQTVSVSSPCEWLHFNIVSQYLYWVTSIECFFVEDKDSLCIARKSDVLRGTN